MDGATIPSTQQFYIDGRWVDPSAPVMIDVVDPASEEVFARIPGGNATDVDRAVTAARRAFETFSLTTREERLALLARIVECYEARAEEIARALSREIGVPLSYARAMQIPIAAQHLRATIRVQIGRAHV